MAQAAGTTRAAPRAKSGCPGAIGGGLGWAGKTCSEVEGRLGRATRRSPSWWLDISLGDYAKLA